MKTAESILHEHVCDYLRLQYPDVLFRTDFAAGEKLSMSQAIRNKRLQACKAWPDLFIAHPKAIGALGEVHHVAGLFIELKAEGTKLWLKDGITPATPHLKDQKDVLEKLEQEGFLACFAVGFESAQSILDAYLHA